MKSLTIVFMTFISFSIFAVEVNPLCKGIEVSKSYITKAQVTSINASNNVATLDEISSKTDLVYVYGDAARELYISIESSSKIEKLGESEFNVKSKGTQIECREQKIDKSVFGSECSDFQCSIVVIQ